MNLETSLAIITICLVLLVLFLICLLVALIIALKKLNRTAFNIEQKLLPLIEEATHISKNTKDITAGVKEKIELTTPLFSTLSKVGQFTQSFSSKVDDLEERSSPNSLEESALSKKKVTVEDWAKWAALGIILWQKIKKRMGKNEK